MLHMSYHICIASYVCDSRYRISYISILAISTSFMHKARNLVNFARNKAFVKKSDTFSSVPINLTLSCPLLTLSRCLKNLTFMCLSFPEVWGLLEVKMEPRLSPYKGDGGIRAAYDQKSVGSSLLSGI